MARSAFIGAYNAQKSFNQAFVVMDFVSYLRATRTRFLRLD